MPGRRSTDIPSGTRQPPPRKRWTPKAEGPGRPASGGGHGQPIPTLAAQSMKAAVDERAACRRAGVNPNWFFGEPVEQREVAERLALDVCASCPVLDLCREYALVVGEKLGIYGGMTEDERRVELKRRARDKERRAS